MKPFRKCHLLLPLSVVQAGLSQALSPSKRAGQVSSCDDLSTPTTFSLTQISYVKIEQYPSMATVPNSTQLVFEVVNNANGVSTGCSPQNVEVGGQWGDDSNYWYKCVDRSLEVNGNEFPLSTSVHIIWDQWNLSVNQSWNCGDQSVVRHISTTTLKPSCQETKSAFQYINECTAPDLEAPAAFQ
ncbi:hypothetical protein F4781DRAFT_430595 [Annulohypoxylon bovei var. microspora]|nr:hypothetical protein F4781DRAFT_430595 [Annulohypoxylon bovei var. microspora]